MRDESPAQRPALVIPAPGDTMSVPPDMLDVFGDSPDQRERTMLILTLIVVLGIIMLSVAQGKTLPEGVDTPDDAGHALATKNPEITRQIVSSLSWLTWLTRFLDASIREDTVETIHDVFYDRVQSCTSRIAILQVAARLTSGLFHEILLTYKDQLGGLLIGASTGLGVVAAAQAIFQLRVTVAFIVVLVLFVGIGVALGQWIAKPHPHRRSVVGPRSGGTPKARTPDDA